MKRFLSKSFCSVMTAANAFSVIVVFASLFGAENAVLNGYVTVCVMLLNALAMLFIQNKYALRFLAYAPLCVLIIAGANICFSHFLNGWSMNAVSIIFLLTLFVFPSILYIKELKNGKAPLVPNGKKRPTYRFSVILSIIILFAFMLWAFAGVNFAVPSIPGFILPNIYLYVFIIVFYLFIKLMKLLRYNIKRPVTFAAGINVMFALIIGITASVCLAMPVIKLNNSRSISRESYIKAFGNEYLKKEGFIKKTDVSLTESFTGNKLGKEKFIVQTDLEYYTESGRSLYADLYYPENTSVKRTVLVRMHGNGANKGLLNLVYMNKFFASLGYVVYDIQYGNKSETSSKNDILYAENPTEMAYNIGRFLKYAMTDPFGTNADFSSVFFNGNSYGGYMSTITGLLVSDGEYPDIFPEGIIIKGLIPIYPYSTPDRSDPLENGLLSVGKDSPPMLLFMGKLDYLVNVNAVWFFEKKYHDASNYNYAYIYDECAGHVCDGSEQSFSSQMIIYYMERFMEQFK